MSIAIKDIKKGDEVYCRETMEEAWVAIEDAKYIGRIDPVNMERPNEEWGEQWEVHLTFKDGEPERFMESTGSEHYGPRLTSQPAYISREAILKVLEDNKESNDNTGSTE